jgi:hypothetical protein
VWERFSGLEITGQFHRDADRYITELVLMFHNKINALLAHSRD